MQPDRHDGHILIVGGGGTGGALAHDLSLRGLRVTLVERGEVTSGTTGRHHGMLHSGGRYAVNDRESAVECIEENMILRRICPGSFELNDGLFVAVEDEDMEYLEPLLEGCEASGIPAQRLTPSEALALEPNLNPALKAAVRVPDGSMDAMRLPLRFFATAQHNGATIRPYTEVRALLLHDHLVSGAVVHDHVTGRDSEIHADVVINAAGPWSEKVAAMAGVDVPIRPSPGVLLALRGRLCNMVINRMHKSGDGDIVVPAARALGRGHELVGGRGSGRSHRPRGSRRADVRRGGEAHPGRPACRAACRLVGCPPARRFARRGRQRTRAVAHLQDVRPQGDRRPRGLRHDHRRKGDDAPRHGGAVRRRHLSQARHRRAVPDPGDGAASPHRLLHRRRTPPRRMRSDDHDPDCLKTGSKRRPSRPVTSASTAESGGDGGGHFDEFDVPIEGCTTLLDALRWIQLNRDPSLSLRHSCLHASCGTCGVRVNGREELACVCSLAEHGDDIRVEPLANLPTLTDVVVDMRPFYDRFPDERPLIRVSEVPAAARPDDDHPFVRLEDCIECAICVSACPVAAPRPASSVRPRWSRRRARSKSRARASARMSSRGSTVRRASGSARRAGRASTAAPRGSSRWARSSTCAACSSSGAMWTR